jgi:hypothetical protein
LVHDCHGSEPGLDPGPVDGLDPSLVPRGPAAWNLEYIKGSFPPIEIQLFSDPTSSQRPLTSAWFPGSRSWVNDVGSSLQRGAKGLRGDASTAYVIASTMAKSGMNSLPKLEVEAKFKN